MIFKNFSSRCTSDYSFYRWIKEFKTKLYYWKKPYQQSLCRYHEHIFINSSLYSLSLLGFSIYIISLSLDFSLSRLYLSLNFLSLVVLSLIVGFLHLNSVISLYNDIFLFLKSYISLSIYNVISLSTYMLLSLTNLFSLTNRIKSRLNRMIGTHSTYCSLGNLLASTSLWW